MERFICPNCKQLKEKYKSQGWCKECCSKRSKNLYAKSKNRREYVRNYVKKWFQNPIHKRMHSIKGAISARKHEANHPEKVYARRTINRLVLNGTILKPNQCSKCKKYFLKERIEAHHSDYTNPLDIIWLCRKCHRNLERKFS